MVHHVGRVRALAEEALTPKVAWPRVHVLKLT